MTHKLYHGDCLDVLPILPPVKCIFVDPPDNIGLAYDGDRDRRGEDWYCEWLRRLMGLCVLKAEIVWISFNARWLLPVAAYADQLVLEGAIDFKPCVQTFSFGQHNARDLGNNHRPLWRLMRRGARLYPEHIREPSWRLRNGDKRADPQGRIPGDVFDFPRVTGNSKQRRRWHPTQLHEGLIERCVKLSTAPGEAVCDPCAGTGTTLRVCKRIDRPCILIERSRRYCELIGAEHALDLEDSPLRKEAA